MSQAGSQEYEIKQEMKRIRLDNTPSTTIENLNDDVLVEIFSHCKADTLMQASLVCKLWSEVIGSSAKVMRHFNLCGTKDNTPVNEHSFRNHQNVNIKYDNKIWAFLGNCDIEQVRDFEIHAWDKNINGADLMTTLQRMPLMEELKLTFTKHESSYNGQRVSFPNLNKLHMASNDCRIYKFIDAPNVRELQVGSIGDARYPPRNVEICVWRFIVFLESCDKITSIVMQSKMFEKLFEMHDLEETKFQLKRFELIDYFTSLSSTSIINDNFSRFLISQGDSLTDLKMPQPCLRFSDEVYKAIFNKLKCLNTLHLHGRPLPKSESSYRNLAAITSLRELAINEKTEFETEEAAKCFYKKFPNITKLTLQFKTKKELSYVAQSNKKVNLLIIGDLCEGVAANVSFDSLKSVTIFRTDDAEHLLSVVRQCPVIEHLNACGLPDSKVTEALIDELLKIKSLRHLFFRGKLETMKMVVDKLNGDYGALKRLEVLIMDPWIKIDFDYPDDRKDWSVAEAEEKFERMSTLKPRLFPQNNLFFN